MLVKRIDPEKLKRDINESPTIEHISFSQDSKECVSGFISCPNRKILLSTKSQLSNNNNKYI